MAAHLVSIRARQRKSTPTTKMGSEETLQFRDLKRVEVRQTICVKEKASPPTWNTFWPKSEDSTTTTTTTRLYGKQINSYKCKQAKSKVCDHWLAQGGRQSGSTKHTQVSESERSNRRSASQNKQSNKVKRSRHHGQTPSSLFSTSQQIILCYSIVVYICLLELVLMLQQTLR